MNRPPPPARPGERITARRENESREATRANRLTAGDGARVVTSRFGTSIDRTADDGDANQMGVITTTCTACTGTHPEFVWGVGRALLLDVTEDGSTSTEDTVTVYNSLQVPLPAALRPVQLKRIGGLLFVDVKDC